MGILIGEEAPDFTAEACTASGQVVDSFNLHQNIDQRYAVLLPDGFHIRLSFRDPCTVKQSCGLK